MWAMFLVSMVGDGERGQVAVSHPCHSTHLALSSSLCKRSGTTTGAISTKTRPHERRQTGVKNSTNKAASTPVHSTHPKLSPRPPNTHSQQAIAPPPPDTYHTPGITAHFLLILSSPNLSTYHFFPFTALGSIAATSFTKKHLAGTHPHPAAIQNPNHSTHSTK